MTKATSHILEKALSLSPVEKANLVDCLLSCLDQPDDQIDAIWKKEVEKRFIAFQKGEVKSISLKEVLAKYQDQ